MACRLDGATPLPEPVQKKGMFPGMPLGKWSVYSFTSYDLLEKYLVYLILFCILFWMGHLSQLLLIFGSIYIRLGRGYGDSLKLNDCLAEIKLWLRRYCKTLSTYLKNLVGLISWKLKIDLGYSTADHLQRQFSLSMMRVEESLSVFSIIMSSFCLNFFNMADAVLKEFACQ